jgi:hypothetical protein
MMLRHLEALVEAHKAYEAFLDALTRAQVGVQEEARLGGVGVYLHPDVLLAFGRKIEASRDNEAYARLDEVAALIADASGLLTTEIVVRADA